jgi:DNA repair exonuclease SbcCD ATPase subunit
VYWSTGSNLHAYNSLSALASAAVQDVLSLSLQLKCVIRDDFIPCSTVIFALGGTETGKTQTIFGSSIAALTGTTNGKADNSHEMGLLGEIMSCLLSSRRLSGYEGHEMPDSSSDPEINCSISILEIVSEDVLRDVLELSKEGLGAHGGSKTLRVRHSDKRGATVSNLRQATCESMDQLHELLHSSFKSQVLKRAWNKEGGHGHFIVNVNVSRPNGGCAKIQLVDLASSDRRSMNAAALRSVRKSLSALRGVLRGVAMQHINQDSASLKAPIPYRESTLTKLLQRSLDHQDGIGAWTRAVVVGTVRPSTKSYTQTLGTIDFMTRILAKAGETAHSPFRDGSSTINETSHSNTVDHDKRTSHRQVNGALDNSRIPPQNSATSLDPPTAALRSITSDPRQRLARLVNSTPLVRDDALSKNGTTFSGSAKSFKIRDSSYGGVLDQLDSLMDIDDSELNRNGYGEGLIDILTPYKSKITSDESSSDSSDVPTPSPFRDSRFTKANDFDLSQLQLKYRRHDSSKVAKSHTAEAHIRSMPSESHEKTKLLVENKDSSVTSTVSFESEPERLSLFPKVSAIDPPSIILPLDSMDSEEPLVSSRGQDTFFGDSLLPQKNNSVFHLAKNSPTYQMFESFKQEIDTLVASLTPRRVRNESDSTQMVDVPDGPSDDTNARGSHNADQEYVDLEAQVTSLSAKMQSLASEKSALEAFLTTIQSIVIEKDVKEAGRLSTQNIDEIMCAITDRLILLVNLESQLESSKAECVKLSSELNQAGENTSNLSQAVINMERDLIEAREKIRSHAESTMLLESQNAQLIMLLEGMRGEQTASADFFNRLDDLLGIRNHDLSGNDESRNQLRFDCIENLKAEINDGLKKLKESTDREQQARYNIEELNSHTHELKSREKELRESISRSEANRIGIEKKAEEAILANENMNNKLKDLRSELAETQKAHEMLSSSHKVALSENYTLRNENEMMKSDKIKHEREILRLNGELAARHKDETQRDIASFKAKTIAVMKQHLERLKVDYAKRIEDFKSSYAAEKESRKGENEVLKRRIEQLEKSTSSELQNAKDNLNRIQGELIWARDDASKQRELNNKIQGELDHLHSLMDIAEESVSELNRLKKENSKLSETIRTQNEQDSRMSITDEDHFMHERISTLMRENEQNNISMRTLQAENVSLKSSIEQCTSTIQLMYSEMSDLKSIAMDGISKLRTKEKSLLEEQQKSRHVITEMENKLENANNLVRLLQSSTGQSSIPNVFPNNYDRPKTPFVHRSSQVENYHTLPLPGSSAMVDRQYAAELSTEKELRCKAEEICAGVLSNSKAALEERDNEISRLRTQLFRLSSKR